MMKMMIIKIMDMRT